MTGNSQPARHRASSPAAGPDRGAHLGNCLRYSPDTCSLLPHCRLDCRQEQLSGGFRRPYGMDRPATDDLRRDRRDQAHNVRIQEAARADSRPLRRGRRHLPEDAGEEVHDGEDDDQEPPDLEHLRARGSRRGTQALPAGSPHRARSLILVRSWGARRAVGSEFAACGQARAVSSPHWTCKTCLTVAARAHTWIWAYYEVDRLPITAQCLHRTPPGLYRCSQHQV